LLHRSTVRRFLVSLSYPVAKRNAKDLIKAYLGYPREPGRRYSYSPPLSPLGTSLDDPIPIDDQLNLKVQLRNRLNTGRLSNMPAGFPFHHTFDSRGSAKLSYDSYEFHEEFRSCRRDERVRSHSVSVSFTGPSSSSHKTQYFSWRAYLPILNSHPYSQRVQDSLAVAHVRVDTAVMDMSYGKFIKNDPRVILRALSISLELGALITVTIAGASGLAVRRQADQWMPGTVVYVGTYNDGRTETLYVTGSRSPP